MPSAGIGTRRGGKIRYGEGARDDLGVGFWKAIEALGELGLEQLGVVSFSNGMEANVGLTAEFLVNMSASADVLAMAKVEVDLNTIPEGKNVSTPPRTIHPPASEKARRTKNPHD